MHHRSHSEHLDTAGRTIALAPDLPAIPERLLLAHARGDVLFLCGAGISIPAGLPDFRQLVLDVYRTLDRSVYEVLNKATSEMRPPSNPEPSALTDLQRAEVKSFVAGEYDVVLGMLERRLDGLTREDSKVRTRVAELLRSSHSLRASARGGMAAETSDADKPRINQPAPIHRALIRLADRGGTTTIMTTNFDLLLESASKRLRIPAQSYALGSIPRPTRRREFSGVLHIHGALTRDTSRYSDLILTDQDFGEFYLRRRVVPDLISDAARLFHLVLVGYRADDPPMRYLLHAVAAEEALYLRGLRRGRRCRPGRLALSGNRTDTLRRRSRPFSAPSNAPEVGRIFSDHRTAEDRRPGNSAHREIKEGSRVGCRSRTVRSPFPASQS